MGDLPAKSSGGRKKRNVFFSGLNFDIEILGVLGFEGEEFHDAKKPIDFKEQELFKEKIRILYRVSGLPQKVKLSIEYHPSEVMENFYSQYTTAKFQPPTVSQFAPDELVKPGEYRVVWGGRDQTPDKRLLLAGRYRVVLEGVAHNSVSRTAETDIVIAKPKSCNFGMHYFKKGWLQTTKKETLHAKTRQSTLEDGTGFSSDDFMDFHAFDAMDEFRSAAVVYWSGHSNPRSLAFYDKEGGKYNRKHSSSLAIYGSGTVSPDSSIIDESPGSFKDLFLVMLNGCRISNEVMVLQDVLNLFFPGRADGISGPKTIGALATFQHVNGLAPRDGTMNQATFDWFGISTDELSEREQLRTIQKRLRRYRAGRSTGKLNSRTRRALRAYQKDHPSLTKTGKLDEPTRLALKLGVRDAFDTTGVRIYNPQNIADAMGYHGADITMGFEHKIDFDLAEDWAMKFWDLLAEGKGVNTAAHNATALVDHRRRKQCTFHIYSQDGVSQEEKLHPARYGKP